VRSSAWRARRTPWRIRLREAHSGAAATVGAQMPAHAPVGRSDAVIEGSVSATTEARSHAAGARDVASDRVREAGGPIDEASYTCACGYVFLARVSTTVACPHCGAGQAW
jgi:hypothetical protein